MSTYLGGGFKPVPRIDRYALEQQIGMWAILRNLFMKTQHKENSLNAADTCLKVVDTHRR